MRWGLTLLDPSTRPMFAEFRAANQVPEAFIDQPYDFRRADTRKIIVLMTDGANYPEERVNANAFGTGFRTGQSPIWRATAAADSSQRYSIFHDSRVNRAGTGTTLATNIANSRPFWVPHLGEWQARPWAGTSPSSTMPYSEKTEPGPDGSMEGLRRRDQNGDGVCDNADDGRGTFLSSQACWLWTRSSQQTWPDVWTNLRMRWVAWQLYARAGYTSLGASSLSLTAVYDAQMNLFRTRTSETAMDSQLLAMCDLARANNVTIYGIAFEAPERGRTAIRNCVSGNGSLASPNYFDAQGLQIRTAFRSIAAQINALSLER
jgi:hypothetical protein